MRKFMTGVAAFITVSNFMFRFYAVPATVVSQYQGAAIIELESGHRFEFKCVPDSYESGDKVKVFMDNKKTSFVEDDKILGCKKISE